MKKILVTGSNGFIGTYLLKEMSKDGNEIIAIVKDNKENIKEIKDLPGVRIVYCELSNLSCLISKISDRDIDICIHLAWAGSSGEARADYELQLQNVKYALDMVKVANIMGIKRYVGAGTLAEKDVLKYHPSNGAKPKAVSMYGIAKISMHFMTKAECSSLGMEHIWCYLSNTYGIGNYTNNFINIASKTMLAGKPAKFTAGDQMYDFVYITDTVRAIYAAAFRGKTNNSYYLGSTKPRQLKEYIKIIRNTIDPSIELQLGAIPFKGKSLTAKEYSAKKIVRDTGFEPNISFEDGIKKTINWLKKIQIKK